MGNLKTLLFVGTLTASLAVVGCSTWGHRDSGRTAGRVVDDNKINDRVEAGLRNEPVYKFRNVDVKTYNGVVQLSGFVLTDDQKGRAGEIAQRVPGVAQVVNNIVLAQPQDENLRSTGGTSGLDETTTDASGTSWSTNRTTGASRSSVYTNMPPTSSNTYTNQ